MCEIESKCYETSDINSDEVPNPMQGFPSSNKYSSSFDPIPGFRSVVLTSTPTREVCLSSQIKSGPLRSSSKIGPSPTGVVPSGPSIPVIATNDRKLSYTSIKNKYGPPAAQNTLNYKPGKWDMWVLGMTIVMGGQYMGWNYALQSGITNYIIAYFLVGSGYITLVMCISELAGSLPFAGGAYGLARCTLGFFPAFLIDSFEALEYITLAAYSVMVVGDIFEALVPSIHAYRLIIWAAIYTVTIYVNIIGDTPFWGSSVFLGSLSFLVLLVYCFGAIQFTDFSRYADANVLQTGHGFMGFLRVLPFTARFFMGIEAVDLACERVIQPKLWIPFGQITGTLTLFVTGTMVLFVTVSLPSGERVLAEEIAPFNNCFTRLFHISYNAATLLSLPAIYASSFGFIWAYEKILSGMAFSKLMPPVMAKCAYPTGTPKGAVICGSMVGFLICAITTWAGSAKRHIYYLCLLFAFTSYTGQCIGYISLKINFSKLTGSNFRSPFGIVGAVYSLCVWLLCFASMISLQQNSDAIVACYVSVVLFLAVVYHGYSKRRQTFSTAENRIMLVPHVMKFNVRRARNHNQNLHINFNSSHANMSGRTTTEQAGPSESATRASKPAASKKERGASNQIRQNS